MNTIQMMHEARGLVLVLGAPIMLGWAMWKSGTSPRQLVKILIGR